MSSFLRHRLILHNVGESLLRLSEGVIKLVCHISDLGIVFSPTVVFGLPAVYDNPLHIFHVADLGHDNLSDGAGRDEYGPHCLIDQFNCSLDVITIGKADLRKHPLQACESVHLLAFMVICLMSWVTEVEPDDPSVEQRSEF